MVERVQSTRKNIMREFKIHELSAVDRPAQVHARMSLMKRADDPNEEDKQELPMQKILTRDRDDPPISFDTLEAAMKHLSEMHGLSKSDAMSRAARENPTLLAKYRDEGERQVTKALERMRQPSQPPAVAEFNALVDKIRQRDMCTGTEALRRARAENPDLYRQYQAA